MVNNKNRILVFLLAFLMPMALFSQTNHWTPVSAPYEDNMTLTGVIQINGTEQQSTALEVGAFCGTECRGSARAMLFPATGRYLVMLTIYGNNGDQITFKLYNHNLGAVLDYQSPSAITFGSNGLGTVTAPYVLNFTGGNHTVIVSASPTAGGTVSGGGTYSHGSTCTLTATANTGYNFVRWTKNGSQVSTNASYSFTVTEDASYVAVFSLKSYMIRSSANPTAGGTVSGGGSYTHGSTCTLTATANSGYTFTNWTKNGSVVSTNASYSFTVTASGNYVANFVEGFNITATASPTAGGTVSGGGIYTNGTTCTLTATPNTGYNFVRWTKNGSQVSTSASYSFTVTEDASYVAVFTLKSYMIRPSASPAEGGTVSGGGSYTHGSTCTLTATANMGYIFTNWTKNGSVVSTNASYSFTVTASGNYVANFSLTATNFLTTLSDDFNDGIIDPELWLSTGNNVYEEEGLLKMDQNITDQNVCLLSKPMSVGTDNKITIDRRFMVHKAYNYYYGGFAIEFNGDTDIHGRPLHADSWDGSIANTFGVDYIGIVYGYTNYENKFGIYVEDGIGSDIQGIRLCDVVFDTWLNERVVIDLSTGTLEYYLDDTLIATVAISGLTALGVNYYTTIFGPWGWWTGHQHYMDYVHINAANAQTTVTIGEGTATCNTNPIGTYYNYSITEQLYTAEEIGMAGTISSVSFYYMGIAAKDLPITMYMKHVDEEDLATAGISLADADEVFSGTLSVTTTAGWVTIDLDNPFYYDGTSNLLIGFIKDYLYYFSGQSWQGTATTSTMARYTQNDNSAYTTSTVPGTAQAKRPNIQMVINPSGVAICDKPETMEASNVTTNSATLTWTSGSGNYNVEYKLASAEDWIRLLNNTTVTTYTLTGLDPGKVYKARAQSVCATNVSGWKNVSFNTQFGIPLVEEFGTNLPMGWAQYTGKMDTIITGGTLGPVTNGWYFGAGNGVFDNHARVNIYSTNCLKWLVMPTVIMEDNVQLMFDVAYTAFSGSGAAPAQTGTDDKFVVLINNGGNWEILRQWDNAGSSYVLNDLNVTPTTVALDLSTFAGNEVAIAFYAESTVSNADNNLHIDNVSIDYIPACPKPLGLAVNYEDGNTATVTWEGDAAGYELDVNGTTYTTTNNTYSLTELELATTYEVKVRANCGSNGYSEWVGPVSFKTDPCMPENKCALTFSVTDSYGDGWNGASIQVYEYDSENNEIGDLLAEITNQNLDGVTGNSQTEPETQIITLNFCDGQPLAIIWSSGSYDSECSYTITDLNEDIVAQDDTDLAMAYTMNCTVSDCRRPTDFAASEIGPRSVKLSWTENGPATEWVIAYMGENDTVVSYITVNTNPYILTGLTPETDYSAQVTPVCELEKPSEVIYWTTLEACPAPTVTITPYPFSANVVIEGFAETYDVERAEHVPYNPSGDALWLQYDNDTVATSIGNSTANTWTWGVMYPASMLERNTFLNKVGIYENSYYTMDSYTVNIYTGGDDAPETLVGTQTVIPTGNTGIHEINLLEPATIDPEQNLWITVTGYGTYILNSCATTEPNNQWVFNSGSWANIGDLSSSLADYGWMIRGFIDNIAPSYDWDTASGVTSPYTITGLDTETDYIVRVKGDCGQDGESGWAYATFSTPTACDAPVDLEATDITYNAATLNWVGYQDSYNLRWWIPAHLNVFNESDFTQVGENYTAADTLVTYTIDLSSFSGIGNVAIRHYNISDMFRLNVDDIVLTNAQGQEIVNEDFESGKISMNWVNYDLDGDGNTWGIWNITQQDNTGHDVGNGSYCATSASYSGSALFPNNWLIIPNVELGGTLTFVARGQDPSWAAEVFGVFVSTNQLVIPGTDPVTVNNVTMPYELTGLTTNTPYAWQVQGINASCEDLEWSAIQYFTTPEQTTVTQTLELTEGWNWISTYIEAENPVAMLQTLESALGDNASQISSAELYTENDSGEWWGELDEEGLTNEQMYMVLVETPCTVELEGTAANPANHAITVNPGWNWIGFPCDHEMTIAEALGGFDAEEGDMFANSELFTEFEDGEWFGDVAILIPGQGFMYFSNSNTTKTLVIGSSKARR